MSYKSAESNFEDIVALLCHNVYNGLGKSGKPKDGTEWTLLSGVLVELEDSLEVVSLGTGTKCLGASVMSSSGDLVNDSHAEVVARRAFLRFLYDQVELTYKHGSSRIFSHVDDNHKCHLRSSIKFHFYTSHVPCGDASIVPIMEGEESVIKLREEGLKCPAVSRKSVEEDEVVEGCKDEVEMLDQHKEDKKRKRSEGDVSPEGTQKEENGSESSSAGAKKRKDDPSEGPAPVAGTPSEAGSIQETDALVGDIGQVSDVHRTGAKCLPGSSFADPKREGAEYHVLGVVRTKPGRGDPTLSVSCSDKLARWIYQGIQGSLLGLLINQPIKFNSITIGGGGQFCIYSLERALITRWSSSIGEPPSVTLLRSSCVFQHSRYLAPSYAGPYPASISWSDITDHIKTEVSVEGRRQGCTKKMLVLGKGRLKICKSELFKKFLSLAPDEYKGKTYREAKDRNAEYQENFKKFKQLVGSWTEKPKIEEFKFDD